MMNVYRLCVFLCMRRLYLANNRHDTQQQNGQRQQQNGITQPTKKMHSSNTNDQLEFQDPKMEVLYHRRP